MDPSEILDRLNGEFLEESTERIELLWRLYLEAQQRTPTSEGLRSFCRELHTMKGQGATFGYPSITLVAHQLEDKINALAERENWAKAEFEHYLKLIAEIIDSQREPEPGELRAKLKALANPGQTLRLDLTVAWICGARVIRHKVRRELEAFGFQVVSTHDPFEGLRFICKLKPEAVICSATTDGLSGFDFIRALSAMSETSDIPVILVTSFDPGHAEIKKLSDTVPVVRLGPTIGDELASALTSLELARAGSQS